MRRRTSRFIVAMALAGIFHIGLIWAVVATFDGGNGRPERVSRPQAMKVSYDTSDEVTRHTEIFDPRPLLIPTEWNVANARRLKDFLQEEKRIFSEYEPMYRAEAGDFITTFGNRWSGLGSPQQIQERFGAEAFRNLVAPLPELETKLESAIEVAIFHPESGKRLFHEVYYNNAALDLARGWPDWKPARFMASVEQTFLSYQMNVLESSGYPEVDERLGDLLALELIGKGVLPDGPYVVEVGP